MSLRVKPPIDLFVTLYYSSTRRLFGGRAMAFLRNVLENPEILLEKGMSQRFARIHLGLQPEFPLRFGWGLMTDHSISESTPHPNLTRFHVLVPQRGVHGIAHTSRQKLEQTLYVQGLWKNYENVLKNSKKPMRTGYSTITFAFRVVAVFRYNPASIPKNWWSSKTRCNSKLYPSAGSGNVEIPT